MSKAKPSKGDVVTVVISVALFTLGIILGFELQHWKWAVYGLLAGFLTACTVTGESKQHVCRHCGRDE